ncbi:MAG: hypothetical protein RBR23_07215 [Arcobacteraceae bacterium]|nr:hypothetical protein [Arcobacteraceae bacterium]
MKQLFLLLCSIFVLYAQDVDFIYHGDMSFFNASFAKDYNTLGKIVKQTDKVKYYDSAFGGDIGVSGSYIDTSLYVGVYFSQRLKRRNSNILKNEATLYDEDLNNLHYIGEAYIQQKYNNHIFSIGRQTKNSQLLDGNHRITKNSFEGLRYRYQEDKLDVDIFYFDKVASSTIANSVPFNHKYGFLGYGMGYNVGNFTDISKHILNEDLSTNGAIHADIKYKEDYYDIELENLYVDNFFNTTSLNATLKTQNVFLKLGTIYQTSVGKDYVERKFSKELKSNLYQGELKYQKNDFVALYRASVTPANTDAIYNGTLFSPFSNKAAWIKGFNTSHAFIADTTSQQVLVYNTFRPNAFPPTTVALSYIRYDIGDKNGDMNYPLDTREKFIQIKSYFSKSLSAKLIYSVIDNVDFITSKTKNTRFICEYVF